MAGIEAENYLEKYESFRSNFDQQLQNLQDIKDEKFDVKAKANEIVRTLGEAKIYLSGQPVTKYAFRQGVQGAKALGQRLGIIQPEQEEAETAVSEGATEETAEASAAADYSWVPFAAERGSAVSRVLGDGGVENSYGEIAQSNAGWPNRPAAEEYLDNDEEVLEANQGAAAGVYDNALDVGQSGMDQALYDNAFDNVAMENPLYEGGSQVSSYLDVAPRAGNNILSEATEDIEGVSNIERTDLAATRALTGVGEGAAAGEEQAGAKAGGKLAAEEGETAELDEIPFVDILGVAAGAGLLIASLVKKPHVHEAVDRISSSYQVGV